MDPIYEAYITTFVEKKETPGDNRESSIYITCKISANISDQWKALVSNLDEADEVESDPHCTFLWAKLDNVAIDEELITDIVKECVDGLGFELMPMGFKIFEEVNDGKQDCLVVGLDAPGDITQIQAELKQKLTSAGVKLNQDYAGWTPHMTIAYFPVDIDIKYVDPSNSMLDIPIKATVDYMKLNNGKEIKFDQGN